LRDRTLMRHEPNYIILTTLSTQNLKVMSLWVFVLIWYSTFSFLSK